MTAKLAQRDHRQPARFLARNALGKGGGERGVARLIGKIGQQPGGGRDIMLARQIAEREQQRDAAAPLAQRAHDVVVGRRRGDLRERRVGAVGQEARNVIGVEFGEPRQKRRVGGEAVERRLAMGSVEDGHRQPLSRARQ